MKKTRRHGRDSVRRVTELIHEPCEQSIPHRIELVLGVGLTVIAVVFVNLALYVGIVAIAAVLILETLARKGMGVRRTYRISLKENIRVYGKQGTRRLIEKYSRDMMKYYSPQ